jgi:hypothetical protein
MEEIFSPLIVDPGDKMERGEVECYNSKEKEQGA